MYGAIGCHMLPSSCDAFRNIAGDERSLVLEAFNPKLPVATRNSSLHRVRYPEPQTGTCHQLLDIPSGDLLHILNSSKSNVLVYVTQELRGERSTRNSPPVAREHKSGLKFENRLFGSESSSSSVGKRTARMGCGCARSCSIGSWKVVSRGPSIWISHHISKTSTAASETSLPP